MKRIISIILVIVFGMSTCVSAVEIQTPGAIHNGIVEYKFNKGNGRFTINTVDGMLNKTSDDGKNLLFLDDVPKTSYTTFKIDGVEYIFGNSYGFMGIDGGIVTSPTTDGNLTTTVWKIKDVYVTQCLLLFTDLSNPNVGNVKITYEVENKGSSTVELGSRILLDTQLGSNDGSPMIIGANYITSEKLYTGANVPTAWKSTDDQYAPNVVSFGLLSGFDGVVPDAFAVGHWESFTNSKWGFTPDPSLTFTSTKNKYGSADSATALYFNPKSLEKYSKITYETYYGIGSLSDNLGDSSFDIKLAYPTKLTVNNLYTGYNEQEFSIIATIDNGGNQIPLKDVAVKLTLPPELRLAMNETDTKNVISIPANGFYDVEFKVTPIAQNTLRVANFGIVAISGATKEMAESSKYIVLPSIQGLPPVMQVTDITPKIIYNKTLNKRISLVGKDFDSLNADNNWFLKIISQNDSSIEYSIPRKNIAVSDNAISLSIPKEMEFDAGLYDVKIVSSNYGTLTRTIEISKDAKYDCKEFGTLVLYKDEAAENKYDIKVFEKSEDINKLTEAEKSGILVTLNGNITSYLSDGVDYYECASGTIINNAILYTAPKDKPTETIKIRRYNGTAYDVADWGTLDDTLLLTGTGKLSIPGFDFLSGRFCIKLSDAEDYKLTVPYGTTDTSGDPPIPGTSTKNVEIISLATQITNAATDATNLLLGYNFKIHNAILGKGTVSLGGSISMSLPPWLGGDKEKEAITGGEPTTEEQKKLSEKFDKSEKIASAGTNAKPILGLDLEELRYQINPDNNSIKLLGLKANGQVNIIDNAIPMISGGVGAKFQLNSLDYPGTYAAVEANVKIKSALELYAKVGLVVESDGGVVPDSVVLSIGGNFVRIPIATFGFLTKLGGGVTNLYNTVKGNYKSLPPIMIKLITGYADPTLIALKIDTLDLDVGPRGFKFNAENGKIFGLKILDRFYAGLELYEVGDSLCVNAGVGIDINVLGVLKGGGSLKIVADPRLKTIFGHLSIEGIVYLGLFIPEKIPFFGGKELLSVKAELSTTRVLVGARIIGIPFSVSYYWETGKTKFNEYADGTTLISNGIVPIEELKNALAVEYTEVEDNKQVAMVYGSNFRKTYSSKDTFSLMGTAPTTHNIPVLNQEYAMFELDYSGDIANVAVFDPNGNKYNLIENENVIRQTISAAQSNSGEDETKLYISVIKPIDGTWKIVTNESVACGAFDVLPLPTVDNVNYTLANNNLKVDWNALNIDDSYTVDVLLSKAQVATQTLFSDEITPENADVINSQLAADYDSGVLIAKGIKASDGTATINLGENIKDGNYQVRVVLKQGTTDTNPGESFSSELSANSFVYKNILTPSVPQNVKFEIGGNGMFKVTYDKVANADGYLVELLDEQGNPIPDFEGIQTTDSVAYIGGKFTQVTDYDADGNVLAQKEVEIATGKSYKLSVSAYKMNKSFTFSSEKVTSPVMLLPIPNAPQLNILVNGSTPVSADEKNPNNVKSTSNIKSNIVTITSNQNVEIAYKVNSEFMTYEAINLQANVPYNLPVDLLDGENKVEFVTKNVNEDYANASAIIDVDTVAPEVMLDNTTIFSNNGLYEIVGTTENNVNVYINDQTTPLTLTNGKFIYDGSISKSYENVSIKALDKAGNQTITTVEIVPNELKSFKKILIKKDGEEFNLLGDIAISATYEVTKGKKQKLRVVGVDENDIEYPIDIRNVKFDIPVGKDKIDIDENGVVSGNYSGSGIVTCQFYPTEGYVFEDAVQIVVNENYAEIDSQVASLTSENIQAIGTGNLIEVLKSTPINGVITPLVIYPNLVGVIYDYTISSNEYIGIEGKNLILKKPLTENTTFDVIVQARSFLDDRLLGSPITRTFTATSTNKIVSVENPTMPITVYTETEFSQISLPREVVVTLDDSTTATLPVIWEQGGYIKNMPALYTINGTIDTSNTNISNPNDVKASIKINLINMAGSTPYTISAIEYETQSGESSQTPVENGNIASVTVSKGYSATNDMYLIIIEYDNAGRVTNMKVQPITYNGEGGSSNKFDVNYSLPQNLSNSNYKILVWESMRTLNPLSEKYSIGMPSNVVIFNN